MRRRASEFGSTNGADLPEKAWTMTPPGREHISAILEKCGVVANMFDHGAGQDEVGEPSRPGNPCDVASANDLVL